MQQKVAILGLKNDQTAGMRFLSPTVNNTRNLKNNVNYTIVYFQVINSFLCENAVHEFYGGFFYTQAALAASTIVSLRSSTVGRHKTNKFRRDTK